jgi:TetR/AcrR family transcriptional regulator, transcriptional repressor for nem operon
LVFLEGVEVLRKGDLTKEKIIDAATKLFKRQGFGLTSISAILSESGLKKGALYYEFSGKEEIGFKVLERAKSELLTFLDSSLVGPTPSACLENYLLSFLEWYRSVQFDEGCIFAHLALEMADTNEHFAAYVRQVFDEWEGKLQEIIEAAQSADEITANISSVDLASLIIAASEGAIIRSRLKKNEQSLDNCFSTIRRLIRPDS